MKSRQSPVTSACPEAAANWSQETTWFFLQAEATLRAMKSSPIRRRSRTLYLSARLTRGMTVA